MAVQSMYSEGGDGRPFQGVNVYAPFALAMDILIDGLNQPNSEVKRMNDLIRNSRWGEFELRKSETGRQLKLYNLVANKFEAWHTFYVILESIEELDNLFKELLIGAFTVAKTNNTYNRKGEFWELTEACTYEDGFIYEAQVYSVSKELLVWMFSNTKGETVISHDEAAEEFKSFLGFVHLISNRNIKTFFQSRPASDALADDFNKWYIWPSLGVFNLVCKIASTPRNDITEGFWSGYTMDMLKAYVSLSSFTYQSVADSTFDEVKRIKNLDLEETASAYEMAKLFKNIDFEGISTVADAYKYPVSIAENNLHTLAEKNIGTFIDVVLRGGGSVSSATKVGNTTIEKIQEVLSKAIFLDGQNRAEFVKSELGNFDDFAEDFGYEKAELIFDILDELGNDENTRLGAKPAKQVAKIEAVEEAETSEFEGCEMVEVEAEEDAEIDDLLDDILDNLDDIFEEGELDDLLDLDLGFED